MSSFTKNELFMFHELYRVPEKTSHFQNQITLETWGHKAQFRCFCNAEIHSYFFT